MREQTRWPNQGPVEIDVAAFNRLADQLERCDVSSRKACYSALLDYLGKPSGENADKAIALLRQVVAECGDPLLSGKALRALTVQLFKPMMAPLAAEGAFD